MDALTNYSRTLVHHNGQKETPTRTSNLISHGRISPFRAKKPGYGSKRLLRYVNISRGSRVNRERIRVICLISSPTSPPVKGQEMRLQRKVEGKSKQTSYDAGPYDAKGVQVKTILMSPARTADPGVTIGYPKKFVREWGTTLTCITSESLWSHGQGVIGKATTINLLKISAKDLIGEMFRELRSYQEKNDKSTPFNLDLLEGEKEIAKPMDWPYQRKAQRSHQKGIGVKIFQLTNWTLRQIQQNLIGKLISGWETLCNMTKV